MRLLYTFFSTLFVCCNFLSAQSFNTETVSQALLKEMNGSPSAFHDIHVVLADRVDIVSLDAMLTEKRATANERSAAVINALMEKASSTQGRVLDILKNSPNVEPGSVKSYWITNLIVAKAKRAAIAELSHNPEIEWIDLNPTNLEITETVDAPAPPPVFSPDGIEPGLAAINAPAMWAMGYTGYGQLSMIVDTGVDLPHPALFNQYRGHDAPAQEAWIELNNSLNPTGNYIPHDCEDHGTHVTGTVLGLDRLTNDTIGVAFNAQWIGAPMIGCAGVSGGTIAAFEWALNPDGNANTSEDMPDVINNSWGSPGWFGNDCFSAFRSMFITLEAAGIAVVFSAGNEGPGPSTINPPANIIINEVNDFCVAAVNGNSPSLPIADFSSRGPSYCPGDSSLQIKPEVAAPGVSVRSSVTGGGYDINSGTSMAAPHVSGALLLLKEAFPDLTGHELKLAIYHTCTDLGAPGEDNNYGMGLINLLEAFNYLVDQGHVPVSPYRANDVMLVHVFNPTLSCNSEVSPIILVENAGTDTLFSFKVSYKAGVTNGDYQWDGILPPKERLTLNLPPVAVALGTQELNVGVEEPNGVADERPLNNKLTSTIRVSDRSPFEAVVEGLSNSVCENTAALLRGVLPDNLQGTGAIMDIDWYDHPFDGSHLGKGEVFTTPLLSQTTTFYADVEYIVPVGPHSKTIGSAALLDTAELGLEFEVFSDLTLDKVHVFVEQTGLIRVKLINLSDGSTAQNISILSSTGKKDLNLGWELTPAKYELVVTNGVPLTYNLGGAVFPYEVSDLISITGTTDGKGDDGVYYFFYDWEVTSKEPCGRAPVDVEVGAAGSPPLAGFTASADTINIDDNETIFFTNSSVNGVEWFWNFGDGTTSDEENPSHEYSSPGQYTVSLIAVDSNGCSGSSFLTIFVEVSNLSDVPPTPEFDEVVVYPNPVKEKLSIFLDLPFFQPVSLRLADSTGRIWATASHKAGSNSVLEIDVANFPPGVYFLLVEMDWGSSVWKVVKI